jgi:hypothetical protein
MSKPRKIEWIVTTSECWECTSHRKDEFGYPKIHRKPGYVGNMSRYIYEQNKGDIPEGLVIRHKCDNPSCINPDHLELGTVRQNFDDRKRHGTWPSGDNHPQARLSNDQVAEIRKSYIWYSKTKGCRALAKEYGVSAYHIWDIIKKNVR